MLVLRNVAVPILVAVMLMACVSTTSAGTAGKIAGIVTDAASGEPIQGATVTVRGSGKLTETDSDGEFFVINLPVGVHQLKLSILGYEIVNVEDVRVLMDLTTPLEIEMTKSPIEMNKSVTVVAKRPIIQRDLTSSSAIVTREEIAYLANRGGVQSVVANLPGTVVDGAGSLHVRGGRQGTVSYYYDGFSVQDPFSGDQGIRIVPDALEELSLISGGISPEYGEAMAGVVNAITREGGTEFAGRFKIYEGATHKYDVNSGEYGDLSLHDTRALLFDLSGPITTIGTRPATFFSSFEIGQSDRFLPHSGYENFTGSGKLVMFPANPLKITVNGSYYFYDRQIYQHADVNGRSYDFNLDGGLKGETESYLFGVKANYTKSSSTVYTLQLNRFRTKTKVAPEVHFDKYWTEWPGYSVDENGVYNGSIQDSNYQAAEEYFYIGYTAGDDYWPYYLNKFAAYTGGKFSVLSQVDKFNQLRIGGELRRQELWWDNRQFYNAQPYGETYSAFPWYGSAYLLDKIEVSDLVVNLGLRFDYMYTNMEYWNDPIKKDQRINSKPKTQLSPRLGISHPVSEHSVLHFNYGYLFQPPRPDLMYTNLEGNQNTGYPLFGNPDLEAEQTIYYELGWSQLINNSIRLSATTYYRDIKNMVGAKEIVDDRSNVYTIFTNADYGSVKGFDFSVAGVNQRFFNWTVNYSFMLANGNASDPFEYYYRYYTVAEDDREPVPTSEYPLAYDQRHKITAVADFRVPKGEQISVLGVPMPDAWGVNMLMRYSTGLPFTRRNDKGIVGEINGERMPHTLRFDARFNKDFFLSATGGFLSFFIEVENLLDRRNVVGVYSNTGLPDDDGIDYTNYAADDYDERQQVYRLYEKDPAHYDSPREVRVGLEYNF